MKLVKWCEVCTRKYQTARVLTVNVANLRYIVKKVLSGGIGYFFLYHQAHLRPKMSDSPSYKSVNLEFLLHVCLFLSFCACARAHVHMMRVSGPAPFG